MGIIPYHCNKSAGWEKGIDVIMNIAVLLGGVGYDVQRRMINGILDSALPDGANVYIFACDGWNYESRFKYENGEYNIYRLPDFTKYDGVITLLDTIHDLKVTEELLDKIREAEVPCVSLTIKVEDAMCIYLDNRTGMREIMEHLVSVHKARHFYYISGPIDNFDARERLEACKETMEKYNLEWNEEAVFYGDYTYKSGVRAVEEYLKSDKPLPDAVVAANDEMAVGAALALRKAGYRIPEDILVTGYDNSSIAQLNHPRMTTVQRGEYKAGGMAYKMLVQAGNHEDTVKEYTVYGEPIFSQSCGCDIIQGYTHTELQEMYVSKSVEMQGFLELLKCCSAEFTGLDTFSDLVECAKRYIKQLDPDYFYVCTCGSIENYYEELERIAEGKGRGRDDTVYMDHIEVPIAYENGEFNSYGEFHKNELLPADCKRIDKGVFYLVMPLHHQESCFGYCVVGNYRPALESRFFQQFILCLDNAMETVRRQDTMRAMLGRLNRIWLHDELTGVHNRAAFRKFAPRIIEEARKRNKPVAVIFADMDDLKKVNDLYGHDEGDAYIRAMADILEKNRSHGELLTRYGGDEFVIVANGYFEKEIKEYIGRIYDAVDRYNHIHIKNYKLDASIGYWIEVDAEKADLDKMVELADQNMYQVKRAKKASK